jgi:YebC/PmpR family DNA-binding regulatory protein
MSGHNKWAQIKRQKGKTDAAKSKIFGKLAKAITEEARRAGGNLSSPGLKTAIEKAKAENMPNDNIERAIKRAIGNETEAMERIVYEAYGPGGSALIIEALTGNRNKAAQEVKFALSKHGFSLASIGSVTWAFQKNQTGWVPTSTVLLSEPDLEILTALIEEIESSDEVHEVFTNAE